MVSGAMQSTVIRRIHDELLFITRYASYTYTVFFCTSHPNTVYFYTSHPYTIYLCTFRPYKEQPHCLLCSIQLQTLRRFLTWTDSAAASCVLCAVAATVLLQFICLFYTVYICFTYFSVFFGFFYCLPGAPFYFPKRRFK